jgi:hypothetical protein
MLHCVVGVPSAVRVFLSLGIQFQVNASNQLLSFRLEKSFFVSTLSIHLIIFSSPYRQTPTRAPSPSHFGSTRLDSTRYLPHLVSIVSISLCPFLPTSLDPHLHALPQAPPHLSLHRFYTLLRVSPPDFIISMHPRTQPTRASSDSQSDTISCPPPPTRTRIQGTRHRTRPTPRLDWTSWLQAKHALESPPPSVPLPLPSVFIPLLHSRPTSRTHQLVLPTPPQPHPADSIQILPAIPSPSNPLRCKRARTGLDLIRIAYLDPSTRFASTHRVRHSDTFTGSNPRGRLDP